MVDNKLDKLWLEEKCRMLFDNGLISYPRFVMEVQYDTHSLNINIITIVFKNLSEILKQTMGPNF